MRFRLFPVLFIAVALLSGCGYNQIQINDEGVNAAWSEVLNQYKRRADLIPNLVSVVQGYAQTTPQEVKKAVLSGNQLMSYIGEYTNPDEPDTPMSFWFAEGHLFVESERRIPAGLTPISETEFRLDDTKATLRFTLDYTNDPLGHGGGVIFSDGGWPGTEDREHRPERVVGGQLDLLPGDAQRDQ